MATLFEQLLSLAREEIRLATRGPAVPMSAPGVLRALSQELNYSPPAPDGFPASVAQAVARARAEAGANYTAASKYQARLAEFRDYIARVEEQLGAPDIWRLPDSPPTVVVPVERIVEHEVALRTRLVAARDILSAAEAEAPTGDALDANAAAEEVTRTRVEQLQGWLARVRLEIQRVKADVEKVEQRRGGAALLRSLDDPFTRPRLFSELVDLCRAEGEAARNLRLQAESGRAWEVPRPPAAVDWTNPESVEKAVVPRRLGDWSGRLKVDAPASGA